MNATPRRGALALLPAASMCLAATAQAQTPACDSLKSTLAARIEATGVRGYSLEAVPGRTAVPPDAKVIGTCEGGAYKMLYRRWGASRPVATAPASMPETKPEPKPLPAPPPVKAASAIPVATPVAIPAVVEPVVGRASEAEAVRPAEPMAAPPAPAVLDKPAEPAEPKTPPTRRASEFFAEHWRWIAALALLPLAAWLWAWRAHRNAYDEAGLPRGPKLN